MQRVVKLKLHPTPDQRRALLETVEQYADCFNVVSCAGWETRTANGTKLHRKTYYPLRERHPSLPSQLVISARSKASEALKSAFQRQKRGKKVTQPKSKMGAVRYDARTYTYWPDRREVSLSSVAGRLKMPVSVPAYFRPLLEQAKGLDSADLVYYRQQGALWLHLVVTLPEPEHTPDDGPVVGVDLGISRIAVTSDNQFFSSKRVKETNNRYFRLRRNLQARGTKSARRKLRRSRRREARFRSDVNHCVSKRLVESFDPGSTIVLEELTDIRDRAKGKGKRQRRQMAGWSFHDLWQKIAYKAQARGIRVLTVDPAYTSQTCPICSHVSKSNRTSQSWFCCQECGYQSNADRVAAINIASKGRLALTNPHARPLPGKALPRRETTVEGEDTSEPATGGKSGVTRCSREKGAGYPVGGVLSQEPTQGPDGTLVVEGPGLATPAQVCQPARSIQSARVY